MRLLILFNNYIGVNSVNTYAQVQRVYDELLAYSKLEVDILSFNTMNASINLRDYYEKHVDEIQEIKLPSTLGQDFAYVHRQWLVENIDDIDHDYIMYMENDLLVPEASTLAVIENIIKMQKQWGADTTGFIRYENKIGRGKEYIDMLPCDNPTVIQRDGDFWQPGNLHSGCWLLHRDSVNVMISDGEFNTRCGENGKVYYGTLESAASDVYLNYHYKWLPVDFESVEIEHLPNRYYGLNADRLLYEIEHPTHDCIDCQPAETVTDEYIRRINEIHSA